jgi:hypothetical protein
MSTNEQNWNLPDTARKYIKFQICYTACKPQTNKVQSTFLPYFGRFEINKMALIKKKHFH